MSDDQEKEGMIRRIKVLERKVETLENHLDRKAIMELKEKEIAHNKRFREG